LDSSVCHIPLRNKVNRLELFAADSCREHRANDRVVQKIKGVSGTWTILMWSPEMCTEVCQTICQNDRKAGKAKATWSVIEKWLNYERERATDDKEHQAAVRAHLEVAGSGLLGVDEEPWPAEGQGMDGKPWPIEVRTTQGHEMHMAALAGEGSTKEGRYCALVSAERKKPTVRLTRMNECARSLGDSGKGDGKGDGKQGDKKGDRMKGGPKGGQKGDGKKGGSR
jgi:hypothetical protein